jgi:ATP-dependent Clp protease adapter protein ClpS/Zn-dependent protease
LNKLVNPDVLLAIGFLALLLGLPLAVLGWQFRKRGNRTGTFTHPTTGYWKVMTIRGVPVMMHPTVLVAGLVIALWAGFFYTIFTPSHPTGFNPVTAIYFGLGYIILIGVHELGHFAAARYFGLKVIFIEISGFGGRCFSERPRAVIDTLVVYCGGLLAQLVLLIGTMLYTAAFGNPTTLLGICLVQTFTVINLIIIVLNIIPGAPGGIATDGAILWRLLLHVWKKAPHPLEVVIPPAVVFHPDTRLASLEGFVPDSFVVGVEILNDNTTPMNLVVEVLVKYLRVEQKDAIDLMLAIHQKGGVVIPLASQAEAETVADGITRDARNAGHTLVCRPMDVRKADA